MQKHLQKQKHAKELYHEERNEDAKSMVQYKDAINVIKRATAKHD